MNNRSAKTRFPAVGPFTLPLAAALLFLALPTGRATALDHDESVSLLGEAEYLFRQANEKSATDNEEAARLYQKAVLRFERIAREGNVESGKLYYNIGNAYFRMQDIGRAILNYRRAEQYIPHDPNLHQNLAYARARRLDRIPVAQKTRVLKTLFFWHYDIPTRARSIAFACVFVLAWLCAAARIFLRRPLVTSVLSLSGILAALLLGSLVVELVSRRANRPGVVLAAEVPARKGDSETYEPSFREPLHAGTEFDLVEDRGDWYHIQLADSRQCSVPAKAVGLVR